MVAERSYLQHLYFETLAPAKKCLKANNVKYNISIQTSLLRSLGFYRNAMGLYTVYTILSLTYKVLCKCDIILS